MPACIILTANAFHRELINEQLFKLTFEKMGWRAILVLDAGILFVAIDAAWLGCLSWQTNEVLSMELRNMGPLE